MGKLCTYSKNYEGPSTFTLVIIFYSGELYLVSTNLTDKALT